MNPDVSLITEWLVGEITRCHAGALLRVGYRAPVLILLNRIIRAPSPACDGPAPRC